MDLRCRFELLGGLCVEQQGRTITRFQTHQTAALLAYLAFFLSRSHPRELLSEICWPGDDRETARRKLRIALSSLRRQLEPPGVPAGAVILANRLTVQLNPAVCTTDVAGFEAGLAAALRATGARE